MSKNNNNFKARVEKGLGRLGVSISNNPWLWFIACTLIVFSLATQLIHLKQDTSVEGYLKKGDPDIALYNEFKDVFGKDEIFLITVAVDVDEIFDQSFIDRLRAFHIDLEDQVPYVESVDSLINARHTYGEEDTMFIEGLLPEKLPENETKMSKLKDYIYSSEVYTDWLISSNKKMIIVAVRLSAFNFQEDENGKVVPKYLEDIHLKQAYAKILDLCDKQKGVLSADIRLAGSIPMAIKLSTVMERDFGVFTGLAIVLIGLVLYIIFRRASGVIMPLVIMVLGVVATISLMAIQGAPLQVSTSILPSFLLAVCVGDSIHLLTIFYRQYDTGVSKVDALSHAMEHSGLAIFFTSITTAAGLASFAFSEIYPVASLGYYGALGSIIAFVLTIFILPTLISIFPLKRKDTVKDEDTRLQPILLWFANFSIAHAKAIVAMGLLIFGGSVYFVSQLGFSHYPMHWLPEQDELRLASENYDRHIGGSLSLEVIIDTGKERGINNAEFLTVLSEIQQELGQWQEPAFNVAKVMAVTDIVKESNRALNGNDQRFYTIPDNSDLISQELFLVELDKPDDLYQMIDRKYQTARMTIMIPMVDAIHILPFLDRVDSYLQKRLAPLGVKFHFTGVTPVLGSTFAKMLYSTAQSYVFAAIAITIMMILLIGSLKLGLISMIPSLLPIFIVLTFVKILGIQLDILTMLVGSIAIGLTVDDNVHFMHGFNRLYQKTGDPAYAIRHTLQSSGHAMLITSIVLSLGFFIYTQSVMNNMKLFGVVTACCIILALFATFLLAPALMMLVNKTWHKQEGRS